jgi:hypothetical protein
MTYLIIIGPFRLASPFIHKDPHEYNSIVTQTFAAAERFDGGCYSEPMMLLRMLLSWNSLNSLQSRDRFCRLHGIAHIRIKYFAATSDHLIDRVNTALRSLGEAPLENRDITLSSLTEEKINYLRLILTWTSETLLRQVPCKTKVLKNLSSVSLPNSIENVHLANFFPKSVNWKITENSKCIYDSPFSDLRKSQSLYKLLNVMVKRYKDEEVASSSNGSIDSSGNREGCVPVVWIAQSKSEQIAKGKKKKVVIEEVSQSLFLIAISDSVV